MKGYEFKLKLNHFFLPFFGPFFVYFFSFFSLTGDFDFDFSFFSFFGFSAFSFFSFFSGAGDLAFLGAGDFDFDFFTFLSFDFDLERLLLLGFFSFAGDFLGDFFGDFGIVFFTSGSAVVSYSFFSASILIFIFK